MPPYEMMLCPATDTNPRYGEGSVVQLPDGDLLVAYSEFVSSDQLAKQNRRAWQMAELDPDEHPVSIQIYGRSPENMARAAVHCADLGADIVDLNLGCPSKAVTGGCSGSAFFRMSTWPRAVARAAIC